MSDEPSKQEVLKAGLKEIRAENTAIQARRVERQSDLLMKYENLPEGRGPFYGNRATLRSTLRSLRYFKMRNRRLDERMDIPKGSR